MLFSNEDFGSVELSLDGRPLEAPVVCSSTLDYKEKR